MNFADAASAQHGDTDHGHLLRSFKKVVAE
jgi:hypothetical protein